MGSSWCDNMEEDYDHNMSRLAMCSSSSFYGDGVNKMFSQLSLESFDGDADEELSDEEDDGAELCYSLPATPRRREVDMKEYGSENEVEKVMSTRRKRRGRVVKKKIESIENVEVEGGVWNWSVNSNQNNYYNSGHSGGESDRGLMVMTRAKGGKRDLCMDMEEVKACRDLGFELEHVLPRGVSFSGSTFDGTSSGGNSPLANWRISSPGDDPRDVKARLKVWAQVVALASTSRDE